MPRSFEKCLDDIRNAMPSDRGIRVYDDADTADVIVEPTTRSSIALLEIAIVEDGWNLLNILKCDPDDRDALQKVMDTHRTAYLKYCGEDW